MRGSGRARRLCTTPVSLRARRTRACLARGRSAQKLTGSSFQSSLYAAFASTSAGSWCWNGLSASSAISHLVAKHVRASRSSCYAGDSVCCTLGYAIVPVGACRMVGPSVVGSGSEIGAGQRVAVPSSFVSCHL